MFNDNDKNNINNNFNNSSSETNINFDSNNLEKLINEFLNNNIGNNSNNANANTNSNVNNNTVNNNTNNFNDNTNFKNQNKEKAKDSTFRFGPLSIGQNNISAFGMSIALDDIIIIGLVIFLLLEDSCDYIIVIVLAFILFDIKLSSLGDIGILRNLNLFN
ncbi:hypothetical protein D3C73_1011800 [compost metagenome]